MNVGRPRERKGRRGKLADELREARRLAGISQDTAALQLGVARVTIARWETGAFRPRGPALRFVQLWTAAIRGEEVNIGV